MLYNYYLIKTNIMEALPKVAQIDGIYCISIGTIGNLAKVSSYSISFISTIAIHNQFIKGLGLVVKQLQGINYLDPLTDKLPTMITDSFIHSLNNNILNFLPEAFQLSGGGVGFIATSLSALYLLNNVQELHKESKAIAGHYENIVEEALSLGICEAPKGVLDYIFD